MKERADVEERFEDVRAERDALRRELGDLRSWLSVKLGLLKREPGPSGLTVISIASDREIIAKIEELTDKRER
ncbi:hypothetical protein SAMN05421504_101402 [Amycolatopsis xylanica]|uniref:Uncharacterized protein n=1 Tax=Amycolatopsis xylanica TaxID=589385 RepID=A0A1H2SZ49_9PSEU|nr:hypothetical protein [Amycolatopsis xylanica]SDW36872.1 hypothetical protein SAMN05421504_101402 [Amycolatopsis xylanica]